MADITQLHTLTSRLTALPLDQARVWLGTFIGASPEALDAIALTLAVSHIPSAFNTLPRLLVHSENPSSGKSSVLHAAAAAGGGRPWLVSATAATIHAIRSTYRKNAGLGTHTTMCLDETDKKFGRTGEHGSEELRGFLTDGYKRMNAIISNQVKGDNSDISTFGVVFMAGLGRAVPEDVRLRSVRIEIRPLAARDAEALRKSDNDDVQLEGRLLSVALNHWAHSHEDQLRQFMVNCRPSRLHRKLYSRNAEIWMPLFAVAYAAGGDWPRRCLAAFVQLALSESESQPPTLIQWMALDTGDFIEQHEADRVLTADLTQWLKERHPERWEMVSTDEMERVFMPQALGPAEQIRAVSVLSGTGKRAQGRYARNFMPAVTALRRQLFPAPEEDACDAHELAVTGEDLTAEELRELQAELTGT